MFCRGNQAYLTGKAPSMTTEGSKYSLWRLTSDEVLELLKDQEKKEASYREEGDDALHRKEQRRPEKAR